MGKIEKYKVGELVVNFDRKRKPLSARQREKMKGAYPYYGAACIFDYINDYVFDGEYILLGEDGTVINFDGTPVLQRISGKTWVNNHAHVLRNSEIIDFDYLYYVLKNANFSGAVTGAVQPKISQANMNAVEVEIYEDKEDQKKVAGILKSLDEKIKLNNKINDNLYEQLASSYKHDYLEKIEDNEWKIMDFGDIVSKFATGLNPRKNFVLGHGENYYVTIKNMGNNQIYLDDKGDKVDNDALVKINARSDLRAGDFLFSGIGTIGRVYYIDETPTNWNISESVFTIRPNDTISREFMYLLLLSKDLQSYVDLHAQGSAQKGIRKTDFVKYKVVIPDDETLNSLTLLWKPLIEQTKTLQKENKKLLL